MPELPPAPACPTWCNTPHPAVGWEVDAGTVVKVCHRTVFTGRSTIELMRHADLADDGQVEIEVPVVVVDGCSLEVPHAAAVAAAMLQAVELCAGQIRVAA